MVVVILQVRDELTLGFDTAYAVAWARDLVAGHGLSLPVGAPTPHPLGLLIGLGLVRLGGAAAPAMTILDGLAMIVCVVAVCRLAVMTAGITSQPRQPLRPPDRLLAILPAVVACAVLLRPELLYLTAIGSIDWVYCALALGGVASALTSTRKFARTTGVVLCSVAALHRPESWLLALALAVSPAAFRWWSRAQQGPRAQQAMGKRARSAQTDVQRVAHAVADHAPASNVQRLTVAVSLIVPLLAWPALGLAFGGVMSALRVSQTNAQSLQRPRGLWTSIISFPSLIASGTGIALAIAGAFALLFMVAAVMRRPRQPSSSSAWDSTIARSFLAIGIQLLGLIAIGAGSLILQGALGTPLLARYFLVLDLLWTSVAAGGMLAAFQHLPFLTRQPSPRSSDRANRHVSALGGSAAFVTFLLIGASAFFHASRYSELTTTITGQRAVAQSLTSALDNVRQCAPIRTNAPAQVPVIAQALDASLSDVAPIDGSSRGTLIQAASATAASDFGFGPPALEAEVPDGATLAFSDSNWAVYVTCS